MSNERKDEPPAASAEERPKRAPPTIDLDASEVSGDTQRARGHERRPRVLQSAPRRQDIGVWARHRG